MAAVDVVANEMLATSRSTVLAIKLAGVVLPRYDVHDEIVLDLTGITLVEALAAGEVAAAAASVVDRAAGDPDQIDDLLGELVCRDLVVAGSAAGPVPPPSADQPLVAAVDRSDDAPLVLPTPVMFRCGRSGFEYYDHDGRLRIRLDATELLAAAAFRHPTAADVAADAHADEVGSGALDHDAFEALIDRLIAAELLVPYDPDNPAHSNRTRQTEAFRDAFRRQNEVLQAFDRLDEEHVRTPGHVDRVNILPVHSIWAGVPASLGVLVAYAKDYDGGKLQKSFDFRPRMLFDEKRVQRAAEEPCIALFSNYIWCHEKNLGLSAIVKQVGTHNVTVHGGPNTPKYEADVERFFADNPHVDITVRGEGEATFADMLDALQGSVGDGPPDLSVLGDVPGLSFRLGERVVQTADRDRIAELDTIPSPVLTGLFDGFFPASEVAGVVLESNRGCPYGCTFCDWGSATLSRIRKFDLDRVFAELEWCAVNRFETVGIADANFGIFERDVEIAEKIAQLNQQYGYPKIIGTNYAKNTVKHLSKIIELFAGAGILAEGKVSLQSMDEGTLATIRRKNIKVEKYNDLSVEFRKNQLPLAVDLMMGLPGATPDALRNDIQECISRNVRAIVHTTMLLPNSPMNEPEYREEHGIVALPGEAVRESASFTSDEWDQMNRLAATFSMAENFGVMRHVATYVRGETGMREVDFYERLLGDAASDTERWPVIAVALQVVPHLMVPPISWKLFIDELHRYVVEVMGVVDDEALEAVLTVQHNLLPARDRSFPIDLSLTHDFVGWRRDAVTAREQGHRDDWHEVVAPLRERGPGTMRIDDPHGVCTTAVGGTIDSLMVESAWDFESPVSRPRLGTPDSGHDQMVATSS